MRGIILQLAPCSALRVWRSFITSLSYHVRAGSSHPVRLVQVRRSRANHCCTQVVIHSLAGALAGRPRAASRMQPRRRGVTIDLLSSRAILTMHGNSTVPLHWG